MRFTRYLQFRSEPPALHTRLHIFTLFGHYSKSNSSGPQRVNTSNSAVKLNE